MPSVYTQAEVSWEVRNTPQDAFGDITYAEPVVVKARKQPHKELVTTSEGKEVYSKHIFYVAPPEGLQIEEVDKLDGELIVEKYIMCTLQNKPKMVRFTTI